MGLLAPPADDELFQWNPGSSRIVVSIRSKISAYGELIVVGEAPLPHDAGGAGHPVVLIHTHSVDQRMWDY